MGHGIKMKKSINTKLTIGLCRIVMLIIFSQPTYALSLTGKVVRISDGDTFVLLEDSKKQHRIRLSSIDAPERKGQAFGRKSKEYLSQLVVGRSVVIIYTNRDRYKRIIGKVLLDNTDINLEMVRVGMAWHYKYYEKDQSEADRKLYTQAEMNARNARIGLWVDTKPMPPWEFRRVKRSSN